MEEVKLPKIYTALIEVNRKVEAIKKGRKNQQQGYSFRGIDDAFNELHALFAEQGIIILSKFISSTREERINKSGGVNIYSIAIYEFAFMAEDGSREVITLQGEGMDNGDKSLNKAFSAALKYALMSMFLIPTDEPKDSEAESHEILPKKPATPPQVNQPKVKKQMPEDQFLKMMGLVKLSKSKEDAGKQVAKGRSYYEFTEKQECILAEYFDNLNQ